MHVCNDIGGRGRSFVLALSKRWIQPEADYRLWHQDRQRNGFAVRAVQFVRFEPDLWVANLRREGNEPPIRHEAIEDSLRHVADRAIQIAASVRVPRIGCGLAGGTWDRIEPIIMRTLQFRHHV